MGYGFDSASSLCPALVRCQSRKAAAPCKGTARQMVHHFPSRAFVWWFAAVSGCREPDHRRLGTAVSPGEAREWKTPSHRANCPGWPGMVAVAGATARVTGRNRDLTQFQPGTPGGYLGGNALGDSLVTFSSQEKVTLRSKPELVRPDDCEVKRSIPPTRRCGLSIPRLAPERRGKSRSRRHTSSPHQTRLRWALAGAP